MQTNERLKPTPTELRRNPSYLGLRPNASLDGRNSTTDFLKQLACTSTSCSVADTICLPFDFVKVRMQLQNELLPSSAPKLSVPAMTMSIARTEGVSAFYTGLPVAVLRQSTYGGLSFASYPHLRDAFSPAKHAADAPLWARILAGGVAGASASALANPTDVVKVRLQADGRLALLNGTQPRYSGTVDAFVKVFREEGLVAFWRGTLPNVQRATFVNGAGIAAYDHSKQVAVRLLGEGDSLLARFVAALAGGVVTSLVGCPFDVLKTRMMNEAAGGNAKYSSTWSCLVATTRVEGFFALWKGLLPVYCRQAPFNLLNYLIMEALTKRLVGKSAY